MVGVSVGSDAAEESAPRTLTVVWDFPEVPLLCAGPEVPDGSPAGWGPGGATDADHLDTALTDRV